MDDVAARLAHMADALIERAGMLALVRLRHPMAVRKRVISRSTEAANALLDMSRQLIEGPDRPRPDTHALAWTEWAHAIAAPVNVIAGWLTILHRVPDERSWLRAADLIDRNAETLTRVLKDPPRSAGT